MAEEEEERLWDSTAARISGGRKKADVFVDGGLFGVLFGACLGAIAALLVCRPSQSMGRV